MQTRKEELVMKKKYLYTGVLVFSLLVVGTEPALGTRYYIPSDTEIGTWDASTRTYTLTTDVSETIEINEDNLTLDGAGHTVSVIGGWPHCGVIMSNRTDITITNVNASGCWNGIEIHNSTNCTVTGNTATYNGFCGIYLDWSSNNCTVTDNTASNNDTGIRLFSSEDCTVASNTTSNNGTYGIWLCNSDRSTVTDNTASNNYTGIDLSSNFRSYYTVTGNTASNNSYCGISDQSSINSTVTGNTASDNIFFGISIHYSEGFTVADNNISNNGTYGIRLYDVKESQIYHNNFIDNFNQAWVGGGSSNNSFNLDRPIGGNYWSTWCPPLHPDNDGDGFVDEPYVFLRHRPEQDNLPWDNLPWARQDGWLNQPPVANAGPDQTVEQDSHDGASVTLDGSGSSDPDGDTLTYLWAWAGGSASGVNPTVLLIRGVTEITLTVSDGELSDTDTVYVTVQDTIAPEISIVAPEPYGLYPVGDLTLDFSASDSGSGLLVLRGTLTDAAGYSGEVDPGFVPDTGVYTLVVSATDGAGNCAESEPVLFVVYDPEGGFVTGGGWIDSPSDAYIADPSLTGKANFGFVSKHKKGATIPTGNTEFVFKAGDLNFHSGSYDWLVVTGSNYARFKGTGTINGYGEYRFMLWAGDNPDTFRIRIWEEHEFGVEDVVYDNGMDQMIDGGSIVIHTE